MISFNNWQRLLNYYITCLEKEVSAQSTFYSRMKGIAFQTNFLDEENLLSNGRESVTIPYTNELDIFIKKAFFRGKERKLFYAYPFVILDKDSILPIFTTEISYAIDKENKTITFKKSPILPEINYSFLSKEGMVPEQIYDRIQEVDALQREGNNKLSPKDKFLEILHLALNQTRFEDQFEINNSKLQKIDFSKNTEEKVYNQPLIYWGEASSYNKSLVYELNLLKKEEYYNQLENTSLAYLFGKKIKKNNNKDPHIFSVIPLNDKQKEAIKKGLSEDITVVTGPPGTGKSQVLVNLIINALINDISVLFASKNNKAIDVVYERLDKLIKDSYVVRSGNRDYRKLAFDTLSQKADNIKYGKNKNQYLKIKNDAIQALSVIEKIKKQKKTRESTEEKILFLEQTNQKNEKKYTWFKKYSNIKISNKNIFKILEFKYKRLKSGNKTFFEIINDFLFKIKTTDKLIDQFNQYFLKNNLCSLKVKNSKSLSKNIDEFKEYIKYKKNLKEINNLKNNLKKIPTVDELKLEIKKAIKFLYEISLSLYENKWLYNLENSTPSQAVYLEDFINVQRELNSGVRLGSRYYRLQERISELISKVIKILPIWGIANLAVKETFPLKGGMFDLAIIDEASQCDIASSIPILFRAKRLMVIGDKKQFKNISSISDTKDINYFINNEISLDYDKYSYNKISLFTIADREYSRRDKKSLILNGHYRCHKDIINFSNRFFYANSLEILTDTKKFIVKEQGLYWYDVKGEGKRPGSGNIYNLKEADIATDMMKKIIDQYGSSINYGIISPFTKQAVIIGEKMAKKLNGNIENLDLTIWTVYKFQGDEKDIIIFSTTVTDSLPEGTIRFVDKEENLMNVAVTRARQKLIIIGDFDFAMSRKNGFLHDLAEYAKSLNHVIYNFD